MTNRQCQNMIRRYHVELHRRALVATEGGDYVSRYRQVLVTGMNPKKLTVSDVSALLLILEIPENVMIDVKEFCKGNSGFD